MISAWFLLGLLVGIAATEIVILIVVKHDENKLSNEEFVEKLIEKKGWEGASWELETSYRGKHMNIWRKLYRKHIEGEEENEQ